MQIYLLLVPKSTGALDTPSFVAWVLKGRLLIDLWEGAKLRINKVDFGHSEPDIFRRYPFSESLIDTHIHLGFPKA